jgi:hypothetical protein
MRHLVLSVLLVVSIGMATAVSVNKLFADEWNLYKVDFVILIHLVYLLTRLLVTGCPFQVIHRI